MSSTLRQMIILTALAGASVDCTSTPGGPPGPTVPALSDDQVASTVELDIRASPEAVYDYVVREDTPARDLRSFGLVPGVRGDVRLTEGNWDRVGARRVVVLEDGSTLHEDIEQLDRPVSFRYRVHDFDFALKTVAEYGRGYWSFTGTPDGTHVVWTYVFNASSCAARPALRAVIGTQFTPFMRHGLARIRADVERRGS